MFEIVLRLNKLKAYKRIAFAAHSLKCTLCLMCVKRSFVVVRNLIK